MAYSRHSLTGESIIIHTRKSTRASRHESQPSTQSNVTMIHHESPLNSMIPMMSITQENMNGMDVIEEKSIFDRKTEEWEKNEKIILCPLKNLLYFHLTYHSSILIHINHGIFCHTYLFGLFLLFASISFTVNMSFLVVYIIITLFTLGFNIPSLLYLPILIAFSFMAQIVHDNYLIGLISFIFPYIVAVGLIFISLIMQQISHCCYEKYHPKMDFITLYHAFIASPFLQWMTFFILCNCDFSCDCLIIPHDLYGIRDAVDKRRSRIAENQTHNDINKCYRCCGLCQKSKQVSFSSMSKDDEEKERIGIGIGINPITPSSNTMERQMVQYHKNNAYNNKPYSPGYSICKKNPSLRHKRYFKQEVKQRLITKQQAYKKRKKSKKKNFFDDIGNLFENAMNKLFGDDESEDEKKDDVDFFDNFDQLDDKIIQFADESFSSVVYAISEGAIEVTEFIEATNHTYSLIQSIPVFNDILPEIPPDDINKAIRPFDKKFSNWSLTFHSNPREILLLKTKQDVIKFILKAKNENKKCRVTNYAHSFSPMFADDGQLLGKMLPDKWTELQPDDFPIKFNKELTRAWVPGYPLMFCQLIMNKNENDYRIIVGGATSNALYIQLCEKRFEEGLYEFPAEYANVLQLYQSWPGTHCMSCHGSGINTTNISVYVERLNIINANGEEKIYKGDILQKMASHMGLLGIVIELEIRMLPPYYGIYKPFYIDFEEAFPKPKNMDPNDISDLDWLQKDVCDNWYNEYFWLPFQKDVYVNSFPMEKDAKDSTLYPPSKTVRRLQELLTSVNELINVGWPKDEDSPLAKLRTKALATATNFALETLDKSVKMPAYNAIHFKYGIQNTRVLDMEFSIPMPRLKDKNGNDVLDKEGRTVPNCNIARHLWRQTRDTLERWHKRKLYPMNLPLEMRIIRGNNFNLCTGNGVDFVCTIEVLTTHGKKSSNDLFADFMQDLLNDWIKVYKSLDRHYGVKMCRPHFGKMWSGLKIEGKDIYEHLRKSYQNDIKEFNQIRKTEDPNNMFVNKGLAPIFIQ